MQTSFKVASILLLAASIAHAQSASFDGKWSGRMVSSPGAEIKVDLSLTKAGGTLRISPSGYAASVDNPDQCHQRDIPVAVDSRTDTALTFVVRGDLALQGCFKGAGALKLIDAKNIEGTLKDGRSFKLVRK
jgi:hypothetical protein